MVLFVGVLQVKTGCVVRRTLLKAAANQHVTSHKRSTQQQAATRRAKQAFWRMILFAIVFFCVYVALGSGHRWRTRVSTHSLLLTLFSFVAQLGACSCGTCMEPGYRDYSVVRLWLVLCLRPDVVSGLTGAVAG